jgi:hypothetical protein
MTRSARRCPVERSADALRLERLEGRIVLSAGVGFDRRAGIVTIVGSEGADAVEVRQQGPTIVVSMNSAAGRFNRTLRARTVSRIDFTGSAGDDSFSNRTAVPSRADGGQGNDTLRGGRGADELLGGGDADRLYGGDGSDRMHGGLGDDALHGGVGPDLLVGAEGGDDLLGGMGDDRLDGGDDSDRLDGEVGSDWLVGGGGLDREIDPQDGFVDGDDDGDGYDNDYDHADILFDIPGNPPAYADDDAAAAIIAAVDAELRGVLRIPATDAGLRTRVQINDGTPSEPGRFGDLVTGVWRYLTPDKIQVWGRWCYPASDPTQLRTFAQYDYRGPFSGDLADYTNPANYSVSDESRLYAGYLMRIGGESPTRQAAFPASVFVGWIPGEAAGFTYTVPGEEATGLPPPTTALETALAGLPNLTIIGDSISGNLSTTAGLPGVQPVVDVLRTIGQTTANWYARVRPRSL